MTEKSFKKIKQLQLRLQRVILDLSGQSDPESWMVAFREAIAMRGPSFTIFLRDEARRISPFKLPDEVSPDNLDMFLAIFASEETFESVMRELPEESASMIEAGLSFIVRELMPSWRDGASRLSKILPAKPQGGRKKEISDAEARKICDEISELHRKRVPILVAQKRIEQREPHSLRAIQRIWNERDKYLGTTDKPGKKADKQ